MLKEKTTKHHYLLVLVGCAAFASPAYAQSSGRDPETAVALAIRSSLPAGPIAFGFLSVSARQPAVAVIDEEYTVTLVGGRWVVTGSRVVRES